MRYQVAMLFNVKYNDRAVTKKCKPYKVDKQYINPMRLTFRAQVCLTHLPKILAFHHGIS